MPLLALPLLALAASAEILCPGNHGGHVQGIATDPDYNIYWSFTVALVKTDDTGQLLAQVEAPSHQCDLTWHDARLYVAVNLGAFNREPGHADSWVYVYDDASLDLLEKHPVPELVHGAGGITMQGGEFILVGGLPRGHDKNHAYRYDAAWNFLGAHPIESGYTNMGIQTACHLDSHFWFGTYNGVDSLIVTSEDFTIKHRSQLNAAYGIAPWKDGQWLRAQSAKGETRGTYTATALIETTPTIPGR